LNGVPCTNCTAAGGTCSGGSCTTGCAGCVDFFGTCQPSTDTTCGLNGVTCSDCTLIGGSCVAGNCNGGGGCVAVGQPCTNDLFNACTDGIYAANNCCSGLCDVNTGLCDCNNQGRNRWQCLTNSDCCTRAGSVCNTSIQALDCCTSSGSCAGFGSCN
jgi:hypothetical protein